MEGESKKSFELGSLSIFPLDVLKVIFGEIEDLKEANSLLLVSKSFHSFLCQFPPKCWKTIVFHPRNEGKLMKMLSLPRFSAVEEVYFLHCIELAERMKNVFACLPSLLRLVIEKENNLIASEATALINYFKSNKSLQSLRISYSRIDDLRLEEIVEALKGNPSLTSLYLEGALEDKGRRILTEYLTNNHSLQHISIPRTKITFEILCPFLESLKVKPIKTLNLSDNKLGKEGALMIAEILKINTSLKELDLSRNYLGLEGGEVLEGLKSNTSLRELNLSWNDLNIENGRLVTEALALNKLEKRQQL